MHHILWNIVGYVKAGQITGADPGGVRGADDPLQPENDGKLQKK